MKEPKPKPKEFAPAQIDLALAEVRPQRHDLVRFATRYGYRLSELFFTVDDIDLAEPQNARVRLRERRGGDDHTIPICPSTPPCSQLG